MPLYMDIHNVVSDDFSVEDVVKAHMQDLAIQEKFGVTQIKYWVNTDAKTIFCLMEGPNREACNKVHLESHGNTACNIIEVVDDEFQLYLGEGKSVNDLAYNNSGEVDTGFRTLLQLSITKFSENKNNIEIEISGIINEYGGVNVPQTDDKILVSFTYASNAIKCVTAIINLFEENLNCNCEYNISILSGRPVDDQGEKLFEETKRKANCLSYLGASNITYCDAETVALSGKDLFYDNNIHPKIKILQSEELDFICLLFESINGNILKSSFKSDDLNVMLALSKSQIYRKTKSLLDTPPNQLILEFRLRKSIEELKKNSKSIAEISFDNGFESPSYFSKVFKKRFGITPSEFVKNNRN